MSRLTKAFTEHPQTVGETYTEHMGVAFRFSGKLFVASLACAVHGILPFLFKKTGSTAIAGLYQDMVAQRDRRPAAPAGAGGETEDQAVTGDARSA